MSYTTMNLDKEIHRQAKIAATIEGITLKDWVERAIKAALDGNGKRLVDTAAAYTADRTTAR